MVWWDHNIPAGRDYDQVIEEQLATVKCVVVLWTDLSINSRNVKDEANEALRRNILIPVLIGNVQPPLGFRIVQGVKWNDNNDIQDDEFSDLLQHVKRLVSVGHIPSPLPVVKKKSKSGLLLLIAAAIVVIAVIGFLMRQPGKIVIEGKFPQASERLLTDGDVSQLSKSDLKIMRNEIYARKGYIFTTADMKSYFNQFSWYSGKNANVNAMLSGIELQNIALIKKYE